MARKVFSRPLGTERLYQTVRCGYCGELGHNIRSHHGEEMSPGYLRREDKKYEKYELLMKRRRVRMKKNLRRLGR